MASERGAPGATHPNAGASTPGAFDDLIDAGPGPEKPCAVIDVVDNRGKTGRAPDGDGITRSWELLPSLARSTLLTR